MVQTATRARAVAHAGRRCMRRRKKAAGGLAEVRRIELAAEGAVVNMVRPCLTAAIVWPLLHVKRVVEGRSCSKFLYSSWL